MTTTATTLLAAALAAILIATPAGEARAGACARMGLEAQVVTHAGDEVPAGAGVLVGWAPQTSWDDTGDVVEWGVDPAVRPTWRFAVGKRRSKPRLVTLAPGLAVYRPVKLTGKASLIDGKGKKRVAVRFGKKKRGFAAAAPEVTAVEVSQYTSQRSGTSTGVVASLATAPPADAVALIVYQIGGTQPRALTWTSVRGQTATQLGVYASPGRCGAHPPDLQAPSVGSDVVLAWVDQFGRVSAMSNQVAVTAAATGVSP